MRSMREVLRRLAAPGPALSIATALFAASAPAQPAPVERTISMPECVAIALRENPDSQSGEYAVREAEAERAGTRGAFGPKLHVDANAQQWNSAFNVPFALGMGAPVNFPVRSAFTWSAGVSLTQPITPLFAIYDQYKVQDLGVDVAAIQRAATRRDVAFQTIEAYYRLLEAGRLADVANASVTQLEAQQKQAQSQFDNGVIGKNDLLRAGLALAGAKQRRPSA